MGAWNSILTYPVFGVSGRDAEENKKSRRKLCETLPPILWLVVGVILLILKLQHTEVGLLASAEEGKLLEALVGLDGEGFVKDISCVDSTAYEYATRVGNDYFFTKDSLSEDDKGFWRCDRKVGGDDIEQPIYRFDNFNVTATARKCEAKDGNAADTVKADCLALSGNEGVCTGADPDSSPCQLHETETVEVEFRGKRHCDADGKHEFNAGGNQDDQTLPSTCSQLGQAMQVNNNVLTLWILQISSLVAIGGVQALEIAASSDSPNKTDKTNWVAMIGGSLLRLLRLSLSLGFVLASLQIVLLSTWAYNHATQDSVAVADALYDIDDDTLKEPAQIDQLRADTVLRLWWLVVASAATAITFLQRDGSKAYRSVEESDKLSLTGDSEPLTGVVGGLQGYKPLADGMIAKIVRNEMTKTKQVHNYY